MVIHNSRIDVTCNSAGGYSFGDLPKPWPVDNEKIWFGNKMEIADDYGHFVFTNLALPMIIPNFPSHVLIAESDGYFPTKNIFNDTSTSGTVDVYIDGGETFFYGNIIDALTGEMITNGTIETPVETSALSFDVTQNQKTFTNQTSKINKSGYFNIRVPGGCNYVTIKANGEQQQIQLSRNITGTQPVKTDIQLIPEPTSFFTIILVFCAINKRKVSA